MDKVRLVRSIARIRKQIFSVVAFGGFAVVCASTVYSRGLDSQAIFINAAVSIIVFGAVGFFMGWVYNRVMERPLIESYRVEAKQRIETLKRAGPQRVVMEIEVNDLQPGMRAVETIHNNEGAMLVKAGVSINNRMIKVLQENKVKKIKVEGQRRIQTEEEFANQMEEL